MISAELETNGAPVPFRLAPGQQKSRCKLCSSLSNNFERRDQPRSGSFSNVRLADLD